MPREYGKNWFSMWTDEHFCTGRLIDKLFYQVLIGQSGMNDAGICPINFRKWRKALRDGDVMPTELDLKASLVRQERRRYVYTDEDTGEVLIRSHIRRDQVFKQPAVLVSAMRDLTACQSPKFAAVMLAELDRIELPEVNTVKPYGVRLKANLEQTHLAAREHLKTLSESVESHPEPFAEDFPAELPAPFPGGSTRESGGGSMEPSASPGKTASSTGGSTGGSSRPPVVVEVGVEVESLVGTHLSNKEKKDLPDPAGSSDTDPLAHITVADFPPEPDYANTYTRDFDEFWAAYPRKVGKRKAFAAWKTARKRAAAQTIIEGAQRYASDPNRVDPFTKHPDGWLNRDGWLDAPLPGAKSSSVDWNAL